jgi:transposase
MDFRIFNVPHAGGAFSLWSRDTDSIMKFARRQILKLIDKIQRSGLSPKRYFATHPVKGRVREPQISSAHYYRYLACYRREGADGVLRESPRGQPAKITPEIAAFVKGLLHDQRQLSSDTVVARVKNEFGVSIDRTTIVKFRQQHGLQQIKVVRGEKQQVSCAGFLLIAALALSTGVLDPIVQAIRTSLEAMKKQSRWRRGQRTLPDPRLRQHGGKFSAAYNRDRQFRETKFASLEEKRAAKDLTRLRLFSTSDEVLKRKVLALLFLPLVTLNGTTRNVNKALGNLLGPLCGFNYKQSTLDKMLRELKYLQVSERLIRADATFWLTFWRRYQKSFPYLVCYYIDGQTKPLWSHQACAKSYVSMLGRVMGCLEQVFVHDRYGRPLYFQTFAGGADLGQSALTMMANLEAVFDVGQRRPPQVTRAMIVDSKANGVAILRAFVKSNYYFVTILDDNQISPRKFKGPARRSRYRWGQATLTDTNLELVDSSEPRYIFETRGILIDWDHGKQTLMATTLPKELVSSSVVVKSYFDRWPHQELPFRGMKATVALHRIFGYGKKKIEDDTVRQRCEQLQAEIHQLQQVLRPLLDQLEHQQERLCQLYAKERRLREKSIIRAGKRILSREDKPKFVEIQKAINRTQREIRQLQAMEPKKLKALDSKIREWQRLTGKTTVYRVDVELDQIMTSFRMCLVHLLCHLLENYLGGLRMTHQNLLHTFMYLPGEIISTSNQRVVKIQANAKEPKMMKLLEKAITKLNHDKIQTLDGRKLQFELDYSHIISQ